MNYNESLTFRGTQRCVGDEHASRNLSVSTDGGVQRGDEEQQSPGTRRHLPGVRINQAIIRLFGYLSELH